MNMLQSAQSDQQSAADTVDSSVLDENYVLTDAVDDSIPDADLSIADRAKRHAKPMHWVLYLTLILIAIIVPYWAGRTLAVEHTSWVVEHYTRLSAPGVVFIAWSVTVAAFTSLALALVESQRWLWRVLLVVFLAGEQFIAGLCLLRLSFWYSTYVVYGRAAGLANAANLGIIAAGCAVAAYAVLFVGLLVMIPKTSPLNVLTRSWASFIVFFIIEVVALLIVLFGGFLTAM